MGEKAFIIDEELVLPASAPKLEKLIRYSLQPEVEESKVLGDKAIFRGNSLVHILYRTEDGSFATCKVELNERLSPASNAQVYYKKYNKSKTARIELTKQIELGEVELRYIDSVFDALTHAETAADLAEIRDELYRSGYASRMKNYTASKKNANPVVAKFKTSGGFTVLCGKNNVQNEYITHKLASKTDYWFHVKNLPGSHTVMLCEGIEPSERDFTEAAEIAACFSKGADGQNVEVDYTLVKNVKKPAGGKPGLVIYHTNWSCIVTPNEEKIQTMRQKGK
jgi:predicted ribosome quality control (RQC) complex YloA/Tae2 family protein